MNVRWQNRGATRLGVHHHQHDHALLGQIKVNHAHAAGLAATGDSPAHFARAASALDDITRERMFGDPVNKCVPLSLRPQLFRLLLKGGGFNDGAHRASMRDFRTYAEFALSCTA